MVNPFGRNAMSIIMTHFHSEPATFDVIRYDSTIGIIHLLCHLLSTISISSGIDCAIDHRGAPWSCTKVNSDEQCSVVPTSQRYIYVCRDLHVTQFLAAVLSHCPTPHRSSELTLRVRLCWSCDKR